MAIPVKQRWILYCVALVLTVVAVQWAGGQDRAQDETIVSAAVERPQREPARNNAAPQQAPAIDLDKLAARTQSATPASDPFAARSWEAMAREEARKNTPPPPPPKPQAPPLPFHYLGKLVEDGHTTVFLADRERNYVVRKGDTVNGTWRIEEIAQDHLTVSFLPLRSKQTLAFDTTDAPPSAAAQLPSLAPPAANASAIAPGLGSALGARPVQRIVETDQIEDD